MALILTDSHVGNRQTTAGSIASAHHHADHMMRQGNRVGRQRLFHLAVADVWHSVQRRWHRVTLQ